jgi:glycosyltransferase involved in cell wall biosynthesis
LFLEQLKNSELVITLPHEQEGFFLPALEAMAMGCIVICPDCIGNQSFCLDGVNAFRPDYCLDAILQATLQALALPESRKQALLKESLRTVENHSLNKERSTFHSLLTNMADEWKAIVDD